MKISALYIVKNEESCLEESIQSILGLVSEIIIIDTGSTDLTRNIAIKYNCKVYTHKWVGDFSRVRNYGIKHCSCDWILNIDADEKLDKESHEVIKNAIVNKNILAYRFNIIDHSDWNNLKSYSVSPFFMDKQIRLFKNHHGIKYKGKIFESVDNCISQTDMQDIDVSIHHWIWKGKEQSFKHLKLKYYQSLYDEDKSNNNLTNYQILSARRIGIDNSELKIEDKITINTELDKSDTKNISIVNKSNKEVVGIIILTMNCLEYTQKCIDSILLNTHDIAYRLFIIDHKSHDGTINYLKDLKNKHNHIVVINCNSNYGIAKGRNRGAEIALQFPEIKYLCFLDNDTVVGEKWLSNMIDSINYDGHIGLVGPKTNFRTGPQNISNDGINIPSSNSNVNIYTEQISKIPVKFSQTESIDRFCMFMPRDIYEIVGPFDDSFGLFGSEELDYAIRVKKYNKSVYIANNSFVYHFGNRTIKNNKLSLSIEKESAKIFNNKWKEINSIVEIPPESNGLKGFNKDQSSCIIWHGNPYGIDGFSIACKNFILNLAELEYVLLNKLQFSALDSHPKLSVIDGKNISNIISTIESRKIPNNKHKINIIFWYMNGIGTVAIDNKATNIAFSMFEADKIEKASANFLNKCDLVFTPSQWNKDILINCGVATPIEIIPLGISPQNTPQKQPGKPYKFLFNSSWTHRKGIDLLLKAYYGTFSEKDDVELNIKTTFVHEAIVKGSAVQFVGSQYNKRLPLNIITDCYNSKQMSNLYESCDCLVMPTRGEGWGLSMSEAGSHGMPVIASNWGGHTEFLNKYNSYLIDIDELYIDQHIARAYSVFADKKVCRPNLEHLKSLMRHVYENQNEALIKGSNLKNDLNNKFTWKHAAKKISSITSKLSKKVYVYGPLSGATGYTNVTQGLILAMNGRYRISSENYFGEGTDKYSDKFSSEKIYNSINNFSSKEADVSIQVLPGSAIKRLQSKKSIIYSMLETDGLPVDWIERYNSANQVWVPSSFNKETFIRSGVSGSKIRILPPYSKTPKFATKEKYPFKELKSFVFLAAGTFDDRKSWRELIKSYTKTFSYNDDVSLILKIDSRDRPGQKKINDMINSWRLSDAHIITMYELITDNDLIKLYNTCDVVVSISKGEGWNMIAFEAMSLGKPVIANRWSAHLDFINDDNGYLADISGLTLAGYNDYTGNRHPLYSKNKMQWAIPSIENISLKMMESYNNREELRLKGIKSKETISKFNIDNHFTLIQQYISEV